MIATYKNGLGNMEIADKTLRKFVEDCIASGACAIVGHAPEGDEGRGWDEFEMTLPDGGVLKGSYGWDEEGFRTLSNDR